VPVNCTVAPPGPEGGESCRVADDMKILTITLVCESSTAM